MQRGGSGLKLLMCCRFPPAGGGVCVLAAILGQWYAASQMPPILS